MSSHPAAQRWQNFHTWAIQGATQNRRRPQRRAPPYGRSQQSARWSAPRCSQSTCRLQELGTIVDRRLVRDRTQGAWVLHSLLAPDRPHLPVRTTAAASLHAYLSYAQSGKVKWTCRSWKTLTMCWRFAQPLRLDAPPLPTRALYRLSEG